MRTASLIATGLLAATLSFTAALSGPRHLSAASQAGKIHTGGENGSYHSTFCPLLKKVLNNAYFSYSCETSQGSQDNIERVKQTPTDIGYAQLDVFALDRAKNSVSAPLTAIRDDLGRECLFMVSKDRSLMNFGQISARAHELKFILPPRASGHTATFEFLQKIDPEGLGLATQVSYAKTTSEAIRKALQAGKGTVALFVQFPDPENERFKLVGSLGGHFIPVIDRNILHQTVDGAKIYFAEETLVENPKLWKTGTKVVTSCTPLVLFTGNPDHMAPGRERVDQQDLISTVRAAPRTQLIPQKGTLKSLWLETKALSARSLTKLLEATDKARDMAAPSLVVMKEKTKEYTRKAVEAVKPAWEATKEKAKQWGEKAKPAAQAVKEEASELRQKAAPYLAGAKEKAKELGQKALPALEAAKEKAKELGQKAAPYVEKAKEKASEYGEKARPFWERTKQRAKEMSEQALKAAREAARKAKEAGQEMIAGDKKPGLEGGPNSQ